MGAYSHPPHATFDFKMAIVIWAVVNRQCHCRHERLPGSLLHLFEVASLGIFVEAEYIQSHNVFQLLGHIYMEWTLYWFISDISKGISRRDPVGNFFLVLNFFDS